MRNKGFTLAELLIALAILGVIATFTIPKVLYASSSGQNKALAKEAAHMISGALSAAKMDLGGISTGASGVTGAGLIPYMNYVAQDITTADFAVAVGSTDTPLQDCSATLTCLNMHTGGILQVDTAQTFEEGNCGTTTTPVACNPAFLFNFDPDGNGGVGAVTFVLFANGRLTTWPNALVENADMADHVNSTLTPITPDPAYIASWN